MNRPVLVLALVSALFLGIALGLMGGVLFANHQLGRGPRFALRMREPGRAGPAGMRMMPPPRVLMPWLRRALDLRPDQEAAILAEAESSRAELRLVHDSLHARITRHLTPAQRARFDRLVRERFPGDPRGRGPHHFRAEPGGEGDPK